MIREFEPRDAAPVAALFREQPFPQPLSAAGILHWLDVQPPRARARMWVGEDDGRIVGWMRARLLWKTAATGAAEVWALVGPAHRGRGHGSRLYDAALGHLQSVGARDVQSWSDEDAGARFLERRGFRATSTERISTLDPRAVAADTGPPAGGVRVVALRELAGRERELHALYVEAVLDVPDVHTEDDVRFEEWRRAELGHPELSSDGSFVALVDERPAAFAFLAADPAARLAANRMTGTVRELRGCGLARLAKLATIRWAAAEGYETVVTTNDESNAGITRLNESLGYRSVGIETQWLKTL